MNIYDNYETYNNYDNDENEDNEKEEFIRQKAMKGELQEKLWMIRKGTWCLGAYLRLHVFCGGGCDTNITFV